MAYRGRTQFQLFESSQGHGSEGGTGSFSYNGRERSVWKGLVSGMVAGAAATWVMTQYQVHGKDLIHKAKQSLGSEQPNRPPAHAPQDQQGQQAQAGSSNPTVQVAERISQKVRGRAISDQHKELAGNLVHYGFGALNGGLYGLLSEWVSLPPAARGLLFGTGLWASVDEVVLPATGFAKWWPEYPTSVHLNALGAHLVYGTTMDVGHRAIRRILDTGAAGLLPATSQRGQDAASFHPPQAEARSSQASVSRFSRFSGGAAMEDVGVEQPGMEEEDEQSRREQAEYISERLSGGSQREGFGDRLFKRIQRESTGEGFLSRLRRWAA